jgi:hypothetical protein
LPYLPKDLIHHKENIIAFHLLSGISSTKEDYTPTPEEETEGKYCPSGAFVVGCHLFF